MRWLFFTLNTCASVVVGPLKSRLSSRQTASSGAGLSRRRFGAGVFGSLVGSASLSVAAAAKPADEFAVFVERYQTATRYIAEMAAEGIVLARWNMLDEWPNFTPEAWMRIKSHWDQIANCDPELRYLVTYELDRRRRAAGLPDAMAYTPPPRDAAYSLIQPPRLNFRDVRSQA